MAKDVYVSGDGRGAVIGVIAGILLYGVVVIGPILLADGFSSIATWLGSSPDAIRHVEANLGR